MSNHERDMSRAAWQRGEGMVIFSNLADIAFRGSAETLPEDKLEKIFRQSQEDFLCENDLYSSIPNVERQTYRVSRALFTEPASRDLVKAMRLPRSHADAVEHHTHFGSVSTVFGDAALTMAHYPLNIAFTASKVAKASGVPGYEANSMADVAELIRRRDLRDMNHIAAFTSNGVLARDADSVSPNLNTNLDGPVVIYDSMHQKMRFSDMYTDILLSSLREVNKDGQSEGTIVESRTSSGCPVRHGRPHLTANQIESESFSSLADHFGMPIEALVAPRECTGIDVGLEFLAETLDRAHAVQQRLAATALTASV